MGDTMAIRDEQDLDRILRMLPFTLYPLVKDHIASLEARLRAAEERERVYREALEAMLDMYDRHAGWCGYNKNAPGDHIHLSATHLAREALATASGEGEAGGNDIHVQAPNADSQTRHTEPPGVVLSAEREFLDASIAVWREIDKYEADEYPGIPSNTELRQCERRAWENFRVLLDRKGET